MTEQTDAPEQPGRRGWLLAIVGLAVLIGSLVPYVAQWYGALFDDAYIYLRYAQNNLGECALQWNCGAGRVEGFTSPLYLLLLTAIGALGVDLESAASWLGIALWFAALSGFVLLPMMLGERLGSTDAPAVPAPIVSLLIAVCLFADEVFAINISSGMEGGLVCLALLAAAWLAFSSPKLLAVVAPWLTVARPELGLATLLQPVLGRDHLRRAAIAAIVAFGSMTLVRFALFGDVLPNTFWAKSGGTFDHLANGFGYIMHIVKRFPAVLLCALGLFSQRRALRYLAAIAIGWLLYFLWSGGDFYSYVRLYVFVVPMAYFVGITAAFELLAERRAKAKVAIVATIVVTAAGIGQLIRPDYAGGFHKHVKIWTSLGHWLKQCAPGASVASIPIGAVSYFSGAPVIDLVGLTDPVVAREGKRASGTAFMVAHSIAHPGHSLGLEPQFVIFDERSESPFDGSQKLVMKFADHEMFQQMARTRAPYKDVSLPLADGRYQLMFVREGRMDELRRNGCLERPPPTD